MEPIKDAFLAPFDASSAEKTSPGKIALAYGLAGVFLALVVRG